MLQPDIRPVGKKLYELQDTYRYYFKYNGKRHLIIVPRGFRYDGASIPLLGALLGFRRDGRIRAAALIHDFLYAYQGKLPKSDYFIREPGQLWKGRSTQWSRKFVDQLFLTIMWQAGLEKTRCYSAYWAVRLFGWVAWHNKK